MVTASVMYGYSLWWLRLQPLVFLVTAPLHTVTAPLLTPGDEGALFHVTHLDGDEEVGSKAVRQ